MQQQLVQATVGAKEPNKGGGSTPPINPIDHLAVGVDVAVLHENAVGHDAAPVDGNPVLQQGGRHGRAARYP